MNSAELVEIIASRLLARGEWLATAESCTGGLIAKLCTDRAGSSGWFERGLVTYSNLAKQQLLGVAPALLDQFGAVSEATVLAMAGGLLVQAPVQHAIAISGIAGPGGGSADKPVGTVWIAWASADDTQALRYQFRGDRETIRAHAAQAALHHLAARLSEPRPASRR